MSNPFWQIVVAIVLILHGLGHALGMMAASGVTLSQTHAPHSWLLSKLLGDTATRAIGFVVWLLALIGFVGAGLGLLGLIVPATWWQPLAVGAAIISLFGLALFWNALPFFFPNKVGVIIVDAVVLVWLWGIL
jgi:hypothetical protein